MKKRIKITVLAALPLLFSCSSPESKENQQPQEGQPSGIPATEATQPQSNSPVSTEQPAIQPVTPATSPAANALKATPAVFHYICPNKCAGGGSEGQGKCPVCKTDLVHNDAFHNQAQQQQPQITAQPQTNPIQLNTANPNQQPQQPQPESPQNAKGVWHYTCPKGCTGGGGQAVACANCGTQLEHNQKYHE